MIQFLNVSHQYPNGRGVSGISLGVSRGEFALLEGPIGAGKTTILRLIYLDLTPQSGQIRIDGQFLHSLRGRDRALLRRKLGIVSPDTPLLPDRTIFDNVALPLRIAGESHRRILLQVNRLLFRFGLQSRARARPIELSSGEQQKTAIARSLVNHPFILLADEPLSNIDSESGAEIVDHLREINSEGTTILAATHHSQPFGRLPGRIMHLNDGRLLDKAGLTLS
ncbi:MAG TPA: ATP-binding cassette domain-containing protein [bacterium]|jgi:cell division transport system ATP-binding protein